MTAEKLREWRGVKPVAGPSGVAISTRLRTTDEDERVLDLVAEHLGALRRVDLTSVCRSQPLPADLDTDARRQARRDRLNNRKAALTAESSARWANAIIAANDDQYRLSRDAQHRTIVGLRTAIATIEKRQAQPTGDTLTAEERKARRKTRMPKGYRPKPSDLPSSAGCSIYAPSWPGPKLSGHRIGCELSRAVTGWPRSATTSTPQASHRRSGATAGTRPGIEGWT